MKGTTMYYEMLFMSVFYTPLIIGYAVMYTKEKVGVVYKRKLDSYFDEATQLLENR